MLSNDNNIIIEIINNRMDGIEKTISLFHSEVEQKFSNLETQIGILQTETRINANDTAHLQTSLYWGFGILTIAIALAPMLKEMFGQLRKPFITEEKVKEIVNKTVNDAVEKAMSKLMVNIGK